MKYLPPKLNVMFKFNYSKYNTRRGLIFIFFLGGGGILRQWKESAGWKVGSVTPRGL